jgi:hypothetical protein
MLKTKLINTKVIGTNNRIVKTKNHHPQCKLHPAGNRQLERLVRRRQSNLFIMLNDFIIKYILYQVVIYVNRQRTVSSPE